MGTTCTRARGLAALRVAARREASAWRACLGTRRTRGRTAPRKQTLAWTPAPPWSLQTFSSWIFSNQACSIIRAGRAAPCPVFPVPRTSTFTVGTRTSASLLPGPLPAMWTPSYVPSTSVTAINNSSSFSTQCIPSSQPMRTRSIELQLMDDKFIHINWVLCCMPQMCSWCYVICYEYKGLWSIFFSPSWPSTWNDVLRVWNASGATAPRILPHRLDEPRETSCRHAAFTWTRREYSVGSCNFERLQAKQHFEKESCSWDNCTQQSSEQMIALKVAISPHGTLCSMVALTHRKEATVPPPHNFLQCHSASNVLFWKQ